MATPSVAQWRQMQQDGVAQQYLEELPPAVAER